MNREIAVETLKKYNKVAFHIRHAYTVEGVMRWYANELGYGDEADFWATVGLLHDVDFENWPEEHCIKAPELLREAGFDERFIHAVCSHAYGMTSDVEPEHMMEKVLFAADELVDQSCESCTDERSDDEYPQRSECITACENGRAQRTCRVN